jgi:hypothetical protein
MTEHKVIIEIGPVLQNVLDRLIQGIENSQATAGALTPNLYRVESPPPQNTIQVDPSAVLGVIEKFLSRAADSESKRDGERWSKY